MSVQDQVNALSDALSEAAPGRKLLAISGPPGAGKAGLAAALHHRMSLQKRPAVVISLDAFLLDGEILAERGLAQRRGAPETYDCAGFARFVDALRDGGEVIAPRYDRARDSAVANAVVVPEEIEAVILEGHYLLYGEAPWDALIPAWDITAFLAAPLPELRARLIQRWLKLNHSRTVATRRTETNDLPNAARVLDARRPADYLFEAATPGAATLSA